MEKPSLTIANDAKLPQFDLPVDFIVYDDIEANLLSYYASFPCKIYACIFCYIVKGNISATINLWQYDIKESDFVVVLPGSFIQIKKVSPDTKISFYGYSSEFLKKMNFWKAVSPIMLDVFKKPIFSLDTELGDIYRDAFSLMTRASMLKKAFNSPVIAHCVMSLIIESIHNAIKENMIELDEKHSSREQAIVAEFLQLAFENYREEHKISFYAREINLTLSHFCNVISKTTGMTPQEIIMNLIIMDAKTQLKGTDVTVTRIAVSLGFPTPTTFNRYFRTYTGMTPQEYRNS
jgi:AraC family transcriptional activator of pobA